VELLRINMKRITMVAVSLILLLFTIPLESFSGSDITVDNVGIPLISSMNGELIPVVCGRGSAIGLGEPSVHFIISNHGKEGATLSLHAEIPEWSEKTVKTIEVGSGESKIVNLNLTFKPRFYNNPERVDAQLNYRVIHNGITVSNGSDTKPIRIAASGTMLWGPKTSRLIAAFVCPKGAAVNKIVQKAKERMGGLERSLIGYQGNPREQAKAVFFALGGDYDLSYVISPMNFSAGNTQIVRAPRESFQYSSANCIDGVVLYASVFENLGLEPLILLGPGHAIVAVRISPGGSIFCIETTFTNYAKHPLLAWLNAGGLGAFEAAVNHADTVFTKWQRTPSSFKAIDIKKERQAGIYPLFTDE
jgi:hypothetical protein